MTRRSPVLVAACLLVALVSASCSSSGSGSSPSIDLSKITCEGEPDKALGDGEICVDSGIRTDNLFSFANWAGRRYKADDFGAAEMIAIYGKDEVCEDSTSTTCQMNPKARVLQAAITSMLLNGRCEGLTVLGALYMAKQGPDPKRFEATSIQQLNPGNEDFANLIDYWWSTQFLEDIVRQSEESKKQGVRSVLAAVIDGLNNSRGVTIGIYSDAGAHSVLPIAVTRMSADEFRIIVWDSNNPRQLTRITVNTESATWRYEGGRINPGQPPKVWEGTDGTIDATSIDTRKGKPVLRIGDGQKGDATVLATSGGSQSLELTVETAAGEKLVATATGSTGAIPGATVTPLKNGDADQVMITMPAGAGAFTAQVRVSPKSGGTPSGAAQLTIEDGTASAFSVAVPASGNDADITVEANPDTDNDSTFSASSSSPGVVTASTASSVIAVDTAADDVVAIKPSDDADVDATITVSGADGRTQVANVPSAGGTGAVQDVIITKSDSGQLRVNATASAPVAVDTRKIESIVSSMDRSAGSGTGFAAVDPDVAATEVRGAVLRSTTTTAMIAARVTSPVETTMWVEYGPDLDWSQLDRTPSRTVRPSSTEDTTVELTGLTSGTKYRYRVVARVSGTLKFTAFNQFVSSGESSFTPAMAAAEVLDTAASVSDVTLSSAVFSFQVSTRSAATSWVEYSQASAQGSARRTETLSVVPGQTLRGVAEVNGLGDSETFRYRVAVSVRGIIVYSRFQEFTTLAKPRTTTVSPKISLALDSTTEESAVVSLTVTSTAPATVRLFQGTTVASTLVRSVAVSTGTDLKYEIVLRELSPGTRYVLRAVLPVAGAADLTASLALTTTAIGSILQTPQVLNIGQTRVNLRLDFPVRTSGRLRLEWGLDTQNFEATSFWYADVTQATSTLEVDTATVTTLLPGSRYRLRAVLTTDDGTFTSQYTTFTTSGSSNNSVLYRATAPTVAFNGGQLIIQWTLSLKDVPSNVTYRVFDGTTQLCERTAAQWGCTVQAANPSITSVVVVSYFDGVEVARSPATTSVTP